MMELSKGERKRGQRAAWNANLFGAAVGMVVQGAVMMLYANDVLGFNPREIATILAVAPWLVVLRLPLLGLIRKIGKRRVVVVAAFGRALVIAGLFVIPADWLSRQYAVFMALIVSFATIGQFGQGAVWQPLMRGITTTKDRGRFFAGMRFAFQVVSTVATGLVAVFIGEAITETQYQLLLGMAFIGMVYQGFWAMRIPEIPERVKSGGFGSFREVGQVIRHAKLLRLPLLIISVTVLGHVPVMVLYLRNVLNVPSNFTTAYVSLGTAGSVCSVLFWGRISDGIGFRRMLIGLLVACAAIRPVLIFAAPLEGDTQTISIAVLGLHAFVVGVTASGIGIATTNIEHYHVQQNDSLTTMNVYWVALAIFASIFTWISGQWLDRVVIPEGSRPALGGIVHLDWLKAWLCIAMPLLHLGLIFVVRRLPESHPDVNWRAYFTRTGQNSEMSGR